jgi:hypothetical protein
MPDSWERLKLRFFGPGVVELSCEDCFELLDAYVELELSGEDAEQVIPGMRAHLLGCPACAEEHDGLFELLATPEK